MEFLFLQVAVELSPAIMAFHLLLKNMRREGDSYFDKFENLKFGMLPSCCILLTDFRTDFVFAPGH